jgi:hypothetical protein
MSDSKPIGGTIGWRDLTVADADGLRSFYGAVAGWTFRPHDMGDYHDYEVLAADGETCIAGLCHARGSNANLPPVWMMYIQVDNVEHAAKQCVEQGGELLDGPRTMGGQLFCAFRDPAGAVAALIGPA